MDEASVDLIPKEVLAKRITLDGDTEFLVHWKGKPEIDDSWMSLVEFEERFPYYKLEGKLGFDRRGIDRCHKVFVRKNKGKVEKHSRDDVARSVCAEGFKSKE